MADEITTSTGTPDATGTAPAAGAAQPPEGATPTQEQQTTFQKWLAGLFSGKEAATAGQEDGTAAGEGDKREQQGKTYTEADLQAEIDKAKATWAAEQQEQARLAKLTPEERAKVESDAKDQQLADLQAKLLQRDLKDAALAKLEKEGFPVGLADLLTYTDQESIRQTAACKIDQGISKVESAPETRPTARKFTPGTFQPYKGKRRKPGTGCVTQINDHLWEGRYSPVCPDGKKHPRNVYAKTREDCEQLLAEMILQMKVAIAAEKERLKLEKQAG